MEYIKVFTSTFIQQLEQRLSDKKIIQKYVAGESPNFIATDVKDTIIDIGILPKLDVSLGVFQNSKNLYESLQDIDRTLASDQRFWTWLAHVPFMEYMSKRWSVADQPEEKRTCYIMQHWFVGAHTTEAYFRHGIALLWWGAHITYDEKRNDPFELTKEFFALYEYTRTLAGSLGKSDTFVHVLLDFIVQNKDYFLQHKEDKVRSLMRRLNFIGAYKVIPALDEVSFRNILEESINN